MQFNTRDESLLLHKSGMKFQVQVSIQHTHSVSYGMPSLNVQAITSIPWRALKGNTNPMVYIPV